MDDGLICELVDMEKKYGLNPAGEGGEIETFVLDSPLFDKRVEVVKSRKVMDSENSGNFVIEKVSLEDKK